MGAYTSVWSLWINFECGGIVRSDVFPDTLPYKYKHGSTVRVKINKLGVIGA